MDREGLVVASHQIFSLQNVYYQHEPVMHQLSQQKRLPSLHPTPMPSVPYVGTITSQSKPKVFILISQTEKPPDGSRVVEQNISDLQIVK